MLLTNRTGVKNTRDLLRAFGGLNETYGCIKRILISDLTLHLDWQMN